LGKKSSHTPPAVIQKFRPCEQQSLPNKTGSKMQEQSIDNSSYRLIFYLDKKDEIYHYSSKEHPKISKIAKFGCEMLQNTENIAL
jgi:hypothetical protein